MGEEKQILEINERVVSLERGEGQPGILVAGHHGGTSVEELEDRKFRADGRKERTHYRECISCGKCSQCIIMRGFDRLGKMVPLGMYCTQLEIETGEFYTCDIARRSKSDHRRVVYDMRNAPIGFEAGLAAANRKLDEAIGADRIESRAKVKGTVPREYKGGEEGYRRKGGERIESGGGEIPHGLAN